MARLARMNFTNLDRVTLDTDMLYHNSSMNTFCQAWKADNSDLGEIFPVAEGYHTRFLKHSTPQKPSVTLYLAHLYNVGEDENLYY